jgi:hypothetical protein
MNQNPAEDLEQRAAKLEREVAELRRLLTQPQRKKDWRATVGMFKDDPYFEEIVELGRQWREEENRKSLEELGLL